MKLYSPKDQRMIYCRQSCCGWLCWLAFFWFAALLWGFSLEELWDVTALRANLVRWRICTNFLTGKLSICTTTAQVWSIHRRNQFHYQFVKLASNASYKQADLPKIWPSVLSSSLKENIFCFSIRAFISFLRRVAWAETSHPLLWHIPG